MISSGQQTSKFSRCSMELQIKLLPASQRKKSATRLQIALFELLSEYRDKQIQPKLDEMLARLGIAYPRSFFSRLHHLAEAGYLELKLNN